MSDREPISVIDAQPWKAIRFPVGGLDQHDFAKWFEGELPGVSFQLYDGAVQHTDTPHDDGSYWQWKCASVGSWDQKDGVESFRLLAGDWLMYRDNELRAVPHWRYEVNYQATP